MSRSVASGLILLVSFAAIAWAMASGRLVAVDMAVAQALGMRRGATPDGLITAAQLYSDLGTGIPRVLMLAAGIGWLLWRQRRRDALWTAATVLGAMGAVTLLKHAFDRVRPAIVPWLDTPANASFPSGHAANTMTLLVLLGWTIGGRAGAVAGGAGAIVMGMTRLWLGVHWASDVVAGWAFGLAMALFGIAAISASGDRPTVRADRRA